MSNSLYPDQVCCSVGSDLVPICLQRLSADNKSCLYRGNQHSSASTNIRLFSHYLNSGRQSRSRSKSASRVRHYSPDGKTPSKYFVRQFGDESSESAESDVESQRYWNNVYCI